MPLPGILSGGSSSNDWRLESATSTSNQAFNETDFYIDGRGQKYRRSNSQEKLKQVLQENCYFKSTS
jgi:hypothetical protein